MIREEVAQVHQYRLTVPRIIEILRELKVEQEMLKRVGRVEPWYTCKAEPCASMGLFFVNTTGIDGSGFAFCEAHAKALVQRSGDEKLLQQARQCGLFS
jgi:hypothetical protein